MDLLDEHWLSINGKQVVRFENLQDLERAHGLVLSAIKRDHQIPRVYQHLDDPDVCLCQDEYPTTFELMQRLADVFQADPGQRASDLPQPVNFSTKFWMKGAE